jgi:hypothetical protein
MFSAAVAVRRSAFADPRHGFLRRLVVHAHVAQGRAVALAHIVLRRSKKAAISQGYDGFFVKSFIRREGAAGSRKLHLCSI